MQVVDSQDPVETTTKDLTINIVPVPQLQITTAFLPNGNVGQQYETYLQVTGGIPPYTWSIVLKILSTPT